MRNQLKAAYARAVLFIIRPALREEKRQRECAKARKRYEKAMADLQRSAEYHEAEKFRLASEVEVFFAANPNFRSQSPGLV